MARECCGGGGEAPEIVEVERVGKKADELATEVKRRKLDGCGGGGGGGSELLLPNPVAAADYDRMPTAVTEDACGSSSSDHKSGDCGGGSSSSSSCCCSSINGSSNEGGNERVRYVDLQEDSRDAETSTCGYCSDRTETAKLLEDSGAFMDSALKTSDGLENSATEASESVESAATVLDGECCCRRIRSTMENEGKMPPEAEVEEFFSAAEKKILEKFTEKYNFDFVKEKPSEGRYKWVDYHFEEENAERDNNKV